MYVPTLTELLRFVNNFLDMASPTGRGACIDAPESDQPLGAESKQRRQQMIDQAGGQVAVLVTDTDRYGWLIAEVYAGEQVTQAVLVGEGLAWNYRQFHQNCPSADRINQVEARAAGGGG